MLIVSQNCERFVMLGGGSSCSSFSYKMEVREGNEYHTIYASTGHSKEVMAEYETRERCIEVLEQICRRYKEETYTADVDDAPFVFRDNIVFEMPSH